MFFRKKSDKERNDESYEQFKALIDLYKHSLSQGNINVVREIRAFFGKKYHAFRETVNHDKEVVYPEALYSSVYEITQHITELNSSRVKAKAWNINAVGLLFGDYDHPKLSSDTYSVIWALLKMMIENGETEMIINYWGSAHQYVGYQLKQISPEHDAGFKITNQEAMSKRAEDRKQFLEFHVALGGLVTYKERYDVLRRFFSYTQSQPPIYDLLPNNMDEVFNFYFSFRNQYEERLLDLEFPFPEMDGLLSSGRISNWVTKYVAIMFLRQYSITGYMTHYNPPTNLPKIPKSQGDRKLWLENIAHFKSQVQWALEKETLLEELKLNFITEDWCRDKNVMFPTTFFEKLEIELQESFKHDEINHPISDKKRKKFEEYTRDFITQEIEVLRNCFSKDTIQESYLSHFKLGARSISDKTSYADEQGSDHLNFHSFLADSFVNNYRDFVAEIYTRITSEVYRLPLTDIAEAVESLGLSSTEHVIMNFNTYLGEEHKIEDGLRLSFSQYQGIDMINVKAGFHLVERSLFVLEKKNLPSLHFLAIENEDIEKLELVLLNKDYELYASLIDLNLNNEIRRESMGVKSDDELKKSVLSSIIVRHEVRCKKSAKVIRIQSYSPYEEQGIIQKVSDIKPFTEKK